MRPIAATILMCGLTLIACGKKEEDKATTTAATPPVVAPTPTPAVTAPPAPVEVETTPDMKAFMGMLDGSKDGASKALAKYGSKANVKNDLGMYTLKDPKVVKAEKVGVMQCYTMESTAGVMKHTTRTCWDTTGKIAQITDKAE